MLGLGLGIGLLNGLLIMVLRVPPVVVTLAMYFVLHGVDLWLVPNPGVVGTRTISWIYDLAGTVGPIPGALFTIGVPLLIWFGLSTSRTADCCTRSAPTTRRPSPPASTSWPSGSPATASAACSPASAASRSTALVQLGERGRVAAVHAASRSPRSRSAAPRWGAAAAG